MAVALSKRCMVVLYVCNRVRAYVRVGAWRMRRRWVAFVCGADIVSQCACARIATTSAMRRIKLGYGNALDSMYTKRFAKRHTSATEPTMTSV